MIEIDSFLKIMKVLLTRDVAKVGKKGEVCIVSDGYARNFLFPKNLAKPATNQEISRVERSKTENRLAREKEYLSLKESLQKIEEPVFFEREANKGTLFGSVTAKDIIEELIKKGIRLTEKNIALEHPIKHIGKTTVTLLLNGEKVGNVIVEIQDPKIKT